jgi:hypothetical protein
LLCIAEEARRVEYRMSWMHSNGKEGQIIKKKKKTPAPKTPPLKTPF